MNEREKRDFRGRSRTRRLTPGCAANRRAATFITPLRPDDRHARRCRAAAGHASTEWALAQPKLELADPRTPLGKAQAAALKASTEGPADGSAFRAVEAAKQYSRRHAQHDLRGRPAGARPAQFLRPDVGAADRHQVERRRAVRSRTSTRRPSPSTSPAPAPMTSSTSRRPGRPSLADGGVIAPLDDYIAKYMNMADLEDYHPLYKALPTYKGKIWGFFDDGDMFALYYRKDIFEDPKLMEAYQAKFAQAARAAEDLGGIRPDRPVHHRPDGAERLRRGPLPQGRQPRQPVRLPAAVPRQWRQALRRRHEGAARLGRRRQDARRTCSRRTRPRSPATTSSTPSSLWAAFLHGQGGDDLLLAADRAHGRRTTRRATRRSTSSRSRRSPARSATRSCRGNPEHATGFNKALSADSANPEAAYLFMQWVTLAAGLAGARACCPTRCATRTASRTSSRSSTASCSRAPRSICQPQQLGQCRPARPDHARRAGLLPLHRPHVHGGLGRRRSEGGAETAAAEWDGPPSGSASDSQKAFYTEFLKLPGATADNTVEKLGMAVKL